MKIKLNMEPETTEKKNKNDTESENKPHASNVELTADELSGRGKTRNFRISKQSIFDQEVVLSDSEDEFVEKKKLRNRSALDDENDSEDMPVVKKPVKVAPIFLKVTPKPKLATEVLEARKQFLMSAWKREPMKFFLA
ncbi:hypothetical protein NQ317_001617 [Molorchus minor]|uniref:Uncharacterized protein n=1 Tax=Molorchus minor TaxID=1323400 RepID=A0ABQ9JR61_9CUCU|nr:hypothetical protein NQ317_001617 [Molorchus minor]